MAPQSGRPTAPLSRRSAALVAAAAVTAATAAFGGIALASSPATSGTVSPPASGAVTSTWTGQIAGANAANDCSQGLDDALNDHHTFSLTVPTGFYDVNDVTMAVTTTAPAGDAILTLLRDGVVVQSSDVGFAGASEAIVIKDPVPGEYDAITCSFAGASTYTAALTLTTVPPASAPRVGGTSDTAAPSTFTNHKLDAVLPNDGAGEPSIGVDWSNGNVYYQAGLRTIKAVFPVGAGEPALTDVTCLSTSVTSLDPILFTDSIGGRTGVSQLLANPVGANSATAFFSGNPTARQSNCGPSNGGGLASGPDHQTLGGGAYPKGAGPNVAPTTAYPRAFYYCSQTLVAGSLCSRSDNGGTAFVNTLEQPYVLECGGLHGHVKVGPEGNVYLPNKACGLGQGLAISEDGGDSWRISEVTGSTPGATDPSVATDRAGNIFFGYVDGNGIPQISTSTDTGASWSAPVSVGEALGIKNAVWSVVVAGDAGRAAFAFIGSPTAGDRNAPGFGINGASYDSGEFHLYIATTVDGGQSYSTVDATPTDPVQRGQICTNGTTCASGRNLLDFNDITVDEEGRVLVGYADGCVGPCVTSTLVSNNSQTDAGRIARQTSGPLLFADAVIEAPAPVVPESPVAVLLPLVAAGLAVMAFRSRRGVRTA